MGGRLASDGRHQASVWGRVRFGLPVSVRGNRFRFEHAALASLVARRTPFRRPWTTGRPRPVERPPGALAPEAWERAPASDRRSRTGSGEAPSFPKAQAAPPQGDVRASVVCRANSASVLGVRGSYPHIHSGALKRSRAVDMWVTAIATGRALGTARIPLSLKLCVHVSTSNVIDLWSRISRFLGLPRFRGHLSSRMEAGAKLTRLIRIDWT